MVTPPSSSVCPETPAAPDDLLCEACETGLALAAQDFDCRAFRDTLGCFATGVAVLTTRTAGGEPLGLTISSFNSVSLDPPLVLWSLSANSPNLESFRRASHFAVNILAANQQPLSDRFAARDNDRFARLAVRQGLGGAPLLDGCCAWFECSNETQHAGGDHFIFIGRVQRFFRGEEQLPLIFHGGRYRELALEFDKDTDKD